MTIADVASTLKQAQIRAFPVCVFPISSQHCISRAEGGDNCIVYVVEPCETEFKSGNNGRPAPPSTPWPSRLRPPRSFRMICPAPNRFPGILLSLEVQNATVFTPTESWTGDRIRWPSRESSLGATLCLGPRGALWAPRSSASPRRHVEPASQPEAERV